MNDKEMIFALGSALKEATITINELVLAMNAVKHNGHLPKDAHHVVESLISNCIKAAQTGREMADMATDYGKQPRIPLEVVHENH